MEERTFTITLNILKEVRVQTNQAKSTSLSESVAFTFHIDRKIETFSKVESKHTLLLLECIIIENIVSIP